MSSPASSVNWAAECHDFATFDRVQVLLGNKTHNRHDSVYGNGLITCGHCGKPFDAIVEGLVLKNGAESRTGLELFFSTIKHMLDEVPHALQLITRLLPDKE